MAHNILVRVFPDSHMGMGHEALTALALKAGYPVSRLEANEFLVFLNKKRDKFKLLSPTNAIVYYRDPNGQRIDLRVLKHIPNMFGAGKLHYSQALEKMLEEVLPPKVIRRKRRANIKTSNSTFSSVSSA